MTFRRQNKWLHLVFCLEAILSQGSMAAAQSELTILTERLPKDFDYNNSAVDLEYYVQTSISEGLLTSDASGNTVHGQAEYWNVSNDGLQYHFKLRDDIYWSDGKPVIANDFILAWQRIVDPSRNNYNKVFLHPLKNYKPVSQGQLSLNHIGISALDKKNILLTLEVPSGHFPAMLQSFKLSPLPSHLSDKELDQMLSGKSDRVLTNGPYELTHWSPKEIYLSKNNLYWDKDQVYYDSIIFRRADNSDGRTAIKSVITGEADIAITRNQDGLNWAKSMYPSYVQEIESLKTEYYVFNTRKDLVTRHDDVREALSMSIDREKISRYIFKGSVAPTHTFSPRSLYYSLVPEEPTWAQLTYQARLNRAHEILKNRGISPKTPASLELKTQNYSNRHKVALLIKHTWKSLGVNLKITTNLPSENYNQLEKGHYQIARAGWIADYPDPYDFLYVLGSKERRFFGTPKASEIDRLLTKSLSVTNRRSRELIFNKIEKINHKKNILMPLYSPQDYLFKSPRITGVGESSFVTSMRWARPIIRQTEISSNSRDRH